MQRGRVFGSTATAAAALVLAAGTALGALRLGTDGADILVGTSGADFFRPKAGADVVRGLAGDDVYEFENGWGRDAVEEKTRYKVAGKTVPGGKDTLSFAKVTASGVQVDLIPQWERNSAIALGDDGANRVDLGASVVEKAVGTPAKDRMFGGGVANVLDGHGGPGDDYFDYGGWNDGSAGQIELPASNDTFAGVAANTAGMTMVQDWGGSADAVDLRPLRLAEVYIDRIQSDNDPELEGLQIVTGLDQWVWVPGQFGEYLDRTSRYGQRGQIEKLVFADVTIGAGEAAGLAAASAKAANDGKNPDLAAAAERLARGAREATPADLPGLDPAAGDDADTGKRSARSGAADRGDGRDPGDAADGGRTATEADRQDPANDDGTGRGNGADRGQGGGKAKGGHDRAKRG